MKVRGIIFDFGFTLFHIKNVSMKKYLDCFKRGMSKSIKILKQEKILEDKGWNVGELSGKKDDLKDFQEKKVNALVVQIQAGKEGIDLTRARYGIFFSYVLSYGDYRQCRKRIRRPGQKNPHTFIHLTVEGSIDTEIMRAYGTKGNVIDYLINLRRKI